MIPYVDYSASLKKGAADTGPPLLDMSIDTPVLGSRYGCAPSSPNSRSPATPTSPPATSATR